MSAMATKGALNIGFRRFAPSRIAIIQDCAPNVRDRPVAVVGAARSRERNADGCSRPRRHHGLSFLATLPSVSRLMCVVSNHVWLVLKL